MADPVELVVTHSVANALIGFDSSSLAATVNEGMTIIQQHDSQ